MTNLLQAATRRMRNIEAFLEPQTIAVIGASDDPKRVGGMPIQYLRRVGFDGVVLPVNNQRREVQGLPAFGNVAEIPRTVDLGIIAVPATHVPTALEDCARAGVRCAIIFTAGFAETGAAGAQLQARISEIIRETGIRVCGPNCAGIMNSHARLAATFGSHLASNARLLPGSVAFVSQSGAVGAYAFVLLRQRGVGVSSWITTGNEVDVQAADFIQYLAGDRKTATIALYLEHIRDVEAFMRACDAARRRGQGLVALVAGRSRRAREVMYSHTAAIADDHSVVRQALGEAGVTVVETIEDLVSVSTAWTARRTPAGRGVGIVTISGGAGILMMDRCLDLGLTVPKLDPEAQRRLKDILPYAATANPIDVTGNISNEPNAYAQFLQSLVKEPAIDAVLSFCGHVLSSPYVGRRLCEETATAARESTKPIFMVGVPEAPEAALLAEARVPLFVEPARAAEALYALVRDSSGPSKAGFTAVRGRRHALPTRRPHPLLQAVPSLSELQARDVLEAEGVRFPRQVLVTSAIEAEQAVLQVGGKAVLKIVSADISHKSDVGGVRVGVSSAAAQSVYSEILAAASAARPTARIDGVSVQEELSGYPAIVGVTVDTSFGPVVLVGTGGVNVDESRDRALALAPVDARGAEELIRRTGLNVLLKSNSESQSPAERRLVELIVAVSRFAWQARDLLSSVELNPVLVSADDAVPVDALIVTRHQRRKN